MTWVPKCHKMAYFVILWHFTLYGIWHKMPLICQYGYQKNRIDQRNWSRGIKNIRQEQKPTKISKNWNFNISFVFLLTFLCKFGWLWAGWTLNLLQKVTNIWAIYGLGTFIRGVFSWYEHFWFFWITLPLQLASWCKAQIVVWLGTTS